MEMIDFGILRTLDDPRTIPLRLINTGARAVHIIVSGIAVFRGNLRIEKRCFMSV